MSINLAIADGVGTCVHNHDWTRLWLDGRYDAVFESCAFKTGEMFEDDPWWLPHAHEVLLEHFPDALFNLLEHDPDRWFDSMLSHSGGRSLGRTDIHARIYEREADYAALRAWIGDKSPQWQGLSLKGMQDHYIAVYRGHNDAVKRCFAERAPERLFCGWLEDRDKWCNIAAFVGADPAETVNIHTNKSSRPYAGSK